MNVSRSVLRLSLTWLREYFFLSGALLLAGMTAASAQQAVKAGGKVGVGHWYSVNADCSSAGRIVISRIRDPQHGSLEVIETTSYPRFLPPNPRVACNTKLEPSTAVIYAAEPKFKGMDQFAFDAISPRGRVKRVARFVSVY